MHGDQSQTDFERTDAIAHIMMHICCLQSGLWPEEWAVKFVLYAITVMYYGDANLNHFVGDWYYLTKSW